MLTACLVVDDEDVLLARKNLELPKLLCMRILCKMINSLVNTSLNCGTVGRHID